jgi:hypothetical protein
MPSLLKANDSGKMYGVPDNERDDALASGKFTEHFRIKTKDSGKEYIIPAGELPEALDSGKFELAEFYDQKKNIEANPTMPKMNAAASFALKAGNSMTMGFGDEIIGALGGDKEGIRKQLRASDEQNPIASFAGSLAGGIASPSLVGAAGKTLASAIGKGALSGALSGGIQGVGENEDKSKLTQDMTRGALFGAVLGAAGGGIGKAISSPKDVAQGVSKAAETVSDTGGAIKAGYEGFKSPTGVDGAVAGNFARIPKASTEFFKYFKEADINRKDIADIAGKLRDELPSAASLSDDQLFLHAMSEPGPNSAKLFAANRVKASGGDDKAFLNLVNLSPEETAAARGFNKVETANELADGMSKTYDAFKSEAGKTFDGLRNKARASFTDQGSKPVQAVSDAITDAGKYKSISGSVRNSLDDVFTDIAGREGDLPFTALEPAEQFDRILQARQRLDKDIKWASQNELAQGQKILADARMKLDSFLKPLDDMAAGDKAYSRFKRIEKQLFEKLGTKERGQIVGFEPTKIEDLLGGTKTSRKLNASLAGFKKQVAEGNLNPEARAKIMPFLEKLDDSLNKSKVQRDLTGFRYQAGPTSPAVQQLGKRISAQSLTDVAGDSPQLFLKLRETIPDNAKAMFNDSFGNLSPAQKEAVTKFSAWRLNNLKASERQMNEVMQTFMKVNK